MNEGFNLKKYHNIAYATSAGLLAGFSFLMEWGWVCMLIGLVLFVQVVVTANTTKQIFLYSWLFASGKSAGGVWWFWDTYPLTTLGFEPGVAPVLLIFFYWLTVALVLGLGVALVLTLAKVVCKQYWYYLLPVSFVLGEVAGSFLFSVYLYGEGGSINAAFSYGYVGYVIPSFVASLPVYLAGVYGASATMVLLAMSIRETFWQRRSLQLSALAGLVGVMIVGNYWINYHVAPEPLNLKVVAIDSQFNKAFLAQERGFANKREAVLEAVERVSTAGADYILLPEDSRFTKNFNSPAEALRWLRERYKTGVVIDSARTATVTGDVVLRAYYYDIENNRVSEIDKQYLVPQGEFVPYIVSWPLVAFGRLAVLESMSKRFNYVPGPQREYEHFRSTAPGMIFCFEIADPLSGRVVQNAHPTNFLVHAASHSWFSNPESLWRQIETMLFMQAIWNKVPIVMAGNVIEGGVYLPQQEKGSGTLLEKSSNWTATIYEL